MCRDIHEPALLPPPSEIHTGASCFPNSRAQLPRSASTATRWRYAALELSRIVARNAAALRKDREGERGRERGEASPSADGEIRDPFRGE